MFCCLHYISFQIDLLLIEEKLSDVIFMKLRVLSKLHYASKDYICMRFRLVWIHLK